MCIFVASTEFTDYAFVLLDNRDEYLDRATTNAHLWDDGKIYSPEDSSKGEQGTWIGLSKQGKLAVLVNQPDPEYEDSPTSRGVLPKQYLLSAESVDSWILDQKTGGYTMLYGAIRVNSTGIEEMNLINHKNEIQTVFGAHEQTIVVSNGCLGDPEWTKVEQAKRLAMECRELHGPELLEKLWSLLSVKSMNENASVDEAKTSIFIPKIKISDREYGTRTQTIILVDYQGNAQYLEKDVASGLITVKDWQIGIRKLSHNENGHSSDSESDGAEERA